MKHTALILFLISSSAQAMQSHSGFFVSGRTSPFQTSEAKGIRCGCFELDQNCFDSLTTGMPIEKAKVRTILSPSVGELEKKSSCKNGLPRVTNIHALNGTTAVVVALIKRCTSCEPELSSSENFDSLES